MGSKINFMIWDEHETVDTEKMEILRKFSELPYDKIGEEDLRLIHNLDLGELSLQVLRHPNCPKDIIQDYCSEPSFWDMDVLSFYRRQLLASNPNCPEDLLYKLSDDFCADVRCAVASNLRCPSECFKKLSSDISPIVLYAIAKNPNCPRFVFDNWLENPNIDSELKYYIVSNVNCPADILEKLSYDSSALIKELIIAHSNCPSNVLSRFITDDDFVHSVLERDELPLSVIEVGLNSKFKNQVLKWIKSTKKIHKYLMRDNNMENELC